MKIKSKPIKNEDGTETALVEMTNVECKALLSSTRYYVQSHKNNPDEGTFKEMWDAEVDLEEILTILHGRKPYREE